MPETSERLIASLAGRYEIGRELGRGGMATVHLAHDVKHDRKVAIKVLLPELAAVLGGERFLNEIKVTANLQHPHILPLFESGEAEGFLYYVMPYVEGETLRDRLNRERQLPLDDALQIAREVADGLGHAHSLGVVHRDIKPENILLSGGHATIADFGIARAITAAGGERMTETGLSLGTPQYMSPEQATADQQIDARSDIYSLACVVYEMLAGETPHTGPTTQSIIAKLMTERPVRLRTVRETVPEPMEQAIMKALARVPADRFSSAAEFSAALSPERAVEPPGDVAAPVPVAPSRDVTVPSGWEAGKETCRCATSHRCSALVGGRGDRAELASGATRAGLGAAPARRATRE
jgi:serine/threonine-protein kinase